MRIDGHEGYSQAGYHAARGWLLIACETIGVGQSSGVSMRDGNDVVSLGVNARSMACGIDGLTPGIVAALASAITTSVLIAQGIRDVVPTPRSEPVACRSSSGITV
jgi:hypothetical protein